MRNKIEYCTAINLKGFLSIVLLLLLPYSAQCQDLQNEQVKRLQRSIFIFNFAQQVGGWPNFDAVKTFKIGVLGNDRSALDLQSLAQKRTIQNKPVEIVTFNFVKSLEGIQVVYVNKKFNYDLEYILSKISGQNILLITEDYNYNSSMINMIGVGNSFKYEINSSLISKEGFSVLPSLKKYAVSSSQKWQELYKKAEQSLSTVKKIEAKQDKLLKDKEQQILTQEELISKQKVAIDTTLKTISQKNDWIKQLGSESELQKQKYEDKLLIEKELEKSIQWQIAIAKAQAAQIEVSNKEIEKQTELLTRQTNEIQSTNKVLKEKNSEINVHKKANLFLIVIVILFVVSIILIYRSYLLKKKLSAKLDYKNNAILHQSQLLEFKNKKLEQFNYIATHDLKVPISNLQGYYSFLKEDLKTDDEELLDTVHWIGKSIEQSMSLISDLTAVIKSDERQMDIEQIRFEVLIDSVLENLNNEISKNKVQLHYDFRQCNRINYGRVELKSILQNLISNSIKYQSPNRTPKININTSFEGEFILLSVSDNGLGIDLDKHLGDLFAPFKRIHTNAEGSGIGLYMIKGIIESSGGRIVVKSELNKGTEFIVYLKRE